MNFFEDKKEGEIRQSKDSSILNWPFILRVLGTFCIPLSVPWLIFQFLSIFRRSRKKSLLKDKVILITGASSGLGEALSRTFYQCGCRLILASRRKEELERVRDSLLLTHVSGPTHPPVILELDLSDLNSLPGHISRALDIHGKIDILINNAGISYRGNILTTNMDVDIKVMLVNYFGQVAITKAVLPSMIEKNCGHIVAVSSVQGKIAIPFRSSYAASKHAMQAFFDVLRSEVADHNIKVSIISPGYIRTSLSLNALTGNGSKYGAMDSATESGYDPKDVAEKVLYAIVEEKDEVTVAPVTPKIAILLRTLFPSLYFWLMQRRARNQAT